MIDVMIDEPNHRVYGFTKHRLVAGSLLLTAVAMLVVVTFALVWRQTPTNFIERKTIAPTSLLTNSNFVDIKDFGAVGDGTTNDTQAVVDALSALKAAGGGLLHFSAGMFFFFSLSFFLHFLTNQKQ